jgi:Xaa-Pro dipeptidase
MRAGIVSQALAARDLAFPVSEYQRRLAAVQSRMSDLGLDALVLFGPENLFYLTGFETIGYSAFQLAVVPAAGEPRLLVRELERGAARRLSWLASEPATVQDGQEPIEAVVRLLDEMNLLRSRLGIDRSSWFFPAAGYLALVARLGEAKVEDGSGLVEQVRRVKSDLELACIRQAARYTEAGMRAGIEAIHEGATDNGVAAAAALALFSSGSEYMSIAPIVTSGSRSGIAHTTFARQDLQAGDAVLLEMGGVHKRYAGPLMRSAVVGPPSDLVRRMYDACARALDAAITAIRPGVSAGSVHAACQSVIDDAGFEPNFRKRLGYSVGVGFAPDWGEGHILHLSRDDPTLLEPGMVFHMPPALREYAVAGVGCSETVAVTADGVEMITSFPRELAIR